MLQPLVSRFIMVCLLASLLLLTACGEAASGASSGIVTPTSARLTFPAIPTAGLSGGIGQTGSTVNAQPVVTAPPVPLITPGFNVVSKPPVTAALPIATVNRTNQPAPTATAIRAATPMAVVSTVTVATCRTDLPCQNKLAIAPATISRPDKTVANLLVEQARTGEQQSMGLMGRSRILDGEGMLFMFEIPAQWGFFMRNTPIPLSIAFIDEKGVIIDIKDLQPFSEETVSPSRPYIWALEVNQGYFARQNIKPGAVFTLGFTG